MSISEILQESPLELMDWSSFISMSASLVAGNEEDGLDERLGVNSGTGRDEELVEERDEIDETGVKEGGISDKGSSSALVDDTSDVVVEVAKEALVLVRTTRLKEAAAGKGGKITSAENP